jgi:hypothetical protein
MTTAYERKLAAWKKRRERALALRDQGLSCAEIGRRMKPQVSRQAVAKLLAKVVG